ncbi:hypothetical protein [Sporolactobacillus sp. KGMB 08714]|uniref:hypothetical protein n=1 Tax=Sporolactobacillus sp. KGMB 08714 TaxID=3064704 RepID=UPI002FBD6F9A
MAFQMTITLPSGIQIENAYVKITDYRGTGNNAFIDISAFKDQASMNNGYPQIEGYHKLYTFTMNIGSTAGDLLTQAYAYLKTLSDFKGATDVLETGQTS